MKSGGKGGDPQGLMVGACTHMSCDTLHRITITIPLLDFYPCHSIRIIRSPDLWEVGQDPQVKAAASGSATLKENMREPFR